MGRHLEPLTSPLRDLQVKCEDPVAARNRAGRDAEAADLVIATLCTEKALRFVMEAKLLRTTADIAREAGQIALARFRSLATLPVEKKGHLDLVTDPDREVEEFLIASLRKAFPEDGVFGEEGGDVTGTSGRIWVIDPIDGTFNFVRGGQN